MKGSVNVKNHSLFNYALLVARDTRAIKYYEMRNSNVFETGIRESAGSNIKSNLNQVKRDVPLNLDTACSLPC